MVDARGVRITAEVPPGLLLEVIPVELFPDQCTGLVKEIRCLKCFWFEDCSKKLNDNRLIVRSNCSECFSHRTTGPPDYPYHDVHVESPTSRDVFREICVSRGSNNAFSVTVDDERSNLFIHGSL